MKKVRLSEVAEINPAGPKNGQIKQDALVDFVPMAAVNEDGSMQVLEQRSYGDVAKGFTAFQANDILLAKITPCYENNKITLADVTTPFAFGSTEFHVIRCDRDVLLPRYVFYFLRQDSVRHAGEKRMTGSTGQKRVPKSFLEELTIPLPPLAEQRRIAAILDEADALRRARRRAIERLNDLGQAVFYEMFGDPDKTSNYKYSLVQLSELCGKITDGTHQPPKWSPIGIPFIFVSNVRNQKISLNTQKFISDETYRELTRNTPIEQGDVLYTAVGSYGNAAEVTTNAAFAFQRHIAHIKPNPAKLNSTFLAYLLESAYIRRQADSNAKGIAQKTVTLADIKRFSVPLIPITEQEQFAISIESVQSLMKQFDCAARKTDNLFSSLQQRAFRGEL